jgi:hypothetical protein
LQHQVEALNGEPSGAEASPPSDANYRAAFTAWLGALGNDARWLASLLAQEDAPERVRRFAAETLNQLFHVADLVPEGVEALAYLEGAFAVRVLARETWASPSGRTEGGEPSDLPLADSSETLSRWAGEAELVESLLGAEDYARLSAIVQALRERRSRGRSPAELLEDGEARTAALAEAQSWAERYRPPSFGSGSHDLVRLLSFLRTRVRRTPIQGTASSATAE